MPDPPTRLIVRNRTRFCSLVTRSLRRATGARVACGRKHLIHLPLHHMTSSCVIGNAVCTRRGETTDQNITHPEPVFYHPLHALLCPNSIEGEHRDRGRSSGSNKQLLEREFGILFKFCFEVIFSHNCSRHPLPATRYPSPVTRHPSPAEKTCRHKSCHQIVRLFQKISARISNTTAIVLNLSKELKGFRRQLQTNTIKSEHPRPQPQKWRTGWT